MCQLHAIKHTSTKLESPQLNTLNSSVAPYTHSDTDCVKKKHYQNTTIQIEVVNTIKFWRRYNSMNPIHFDNKMYNSVETIKPQSHQHTYYSTFKSRETVTPSATLSFTRDTRPKGTATQRHSLKQTL